MTKTSGTVYETCGCRQPGTGRCGGRACSRLGDIEDGRWYFNCAVRDMWGRRHQIRRGGLQSRMSAVRARNAVQRHSREQATARLCTVERWLEFWLDPG